MSHPLLSRSHLEALLIARTIVTAPDDRWLILQRVDRDGLSVPAWALLEQLAVDDGEPVHTPSKARHALADRVELITVGDLCSYSLETLIALVNQFPKPAPRQQAWERDLAIATGAAA